MKSQILVIGANGQLGTVLTEALRAKYGHKAVLATDIKRPTKPDHNFEMLDIVNGQRVKEIIGDYQIKEIYLLAAILSANGEWNPMKTWNVNLNGLLTVLQLAREMNIQKIFFPSTIAVFGKTTPRQNTPQHTTLEPSTVYGMSKQSGELWCNYYNQKYGIDVRSLRYPGIISHQSMPGGGTTDYAVEIFHEAIKNKQYTCFLGPETRLPMLYMADAIRATLELMDAPAESLSIRSSYNLSAMSFTPRELFKEIKKHIPDFTIKYEPDFRQEIADSWSESIDDSFARKDWNWKPNFDLASMTIEMINQLNKKYSNV